MHALILVGLLLAPAPAGPSTTAQTSATQQPAVPPQVEVRKLYEAGKYQELVQKAPDAIKANEAAKASIQYMAAQSYQKLGQWDQVRNLYKELAARDVKDPWHFVGLSGEALVNHQNAQSVQMAQKAVDLGPDNPYAYYQLGMAFSLVPDFAKAANAFQKAALLDPTFAYAHYYAAMSYYKLKRIDLMATHFEAFLKLAPDAPEVPQVQAIMRTVRGG
ncbi:MAG: tetratricopeptide repeat protein [Acidobacteriota bacterium]|nr:tetratricopeptide repeat protein [Acidobacteriota bacterium]